jgi:hypothetical protein
LSAHQRELIERGHATGEAAEVDTAAARVNCDPPPMLRSLLRPRPLVLMAAAGFIPKAPAAVLAVALDVVLQKGRAWGRGREHLGTDR